MNPDHTLKAYLQDWTDWDGAMWTLGVVLGLWNPREHSFQTDVKHVMWSDNDLGTLLANMLMGLAEKGILERRDEPDDQFRWNPNFKGSWE